MEELASLIPVIIIAVISAFAKSASKNKQTQTRQQHPYQQGMAAARPQQPRPAAPAARPAPMASPLPRQDAPHTVAQPTVHTHLDPDCDTHDAPASGSLGVRSPEGKDPCHEEQLPRHRAAVAEPAAEAPGLKLDWSGDAMVRAFVMQEVLTRPCDRRRHAAR